VIGVVQDGDIVIGKLSLTCDATSCTAALGNLNLLGRQPGLNSHSRFEADASLTRIDYYFSNGDKYSFNGTLFARMEEVADRVSGGNFDQKTMAAYRSRATTKVSLRTRTSSLILWEYFSTARPLSSTSCLRPMDLRARQTW
jgi:hypothetical protein